MNAPARQIIAAPHWAASETQAAHALLEKLLRRLDPDSDAASMVYHAMEGVEAADYAVGLGS